MSRPPLPPPLLLAGRVVGAGLLVGMGAIHFHLWNTGYRHIPTIGVLFLLNVIGALIVALAVLVTPTRLVALPAAGGAAMAAGTLVGLIISVSHGLFGFKDSTNAPDFVLSIVVEVAAIVVLAGLALASRPQLVLRRGTVAADRGVAQR